MAVKKKSAPKKKVAAKKKVVKKKTIGEISPHTAKVAIAIDKAKASPKKKTTKKKSAPKKKAPAKKLARKRSRDLGPIPKYHLNHQSWDKPVVMREICDQMLGCSKGIAFVCRDDDNLPDIATVFKWLAEESKGGGESPLRDMYEICKEIQVDFMADEIVEISDNEANQPLVIDGVPVVVEGKPVKYTDSASVAHARLRVDSRKWIASKLKHRKYGDKLEVSGDPERPLAGLTTEQLILRQKQLEEKLGGGG